MGAAASWFFVPSNVIEAQNANQTMLQAKAEELNGSPNILATVKQDKTAATTLQNMNRDVFLSGDRDRESGQAVVSAFMDSIEQIPQNIKNAAEGASKTIGSSLGFAVPVWLRWLVGIALVAVVLWLVVKLVVTGKEIAA